MAAKGNLVIDQGADYDKTVNLSDGDGTNLNLTGYTCLAQIRKHYTSTTAVDFTVGFSADRSDGNINLTLTDVQTAAMAPGRYVYDVSLTDASGKKERVVEGIVSVMPSVTRPTA